MFGTLEQAMTHLFAPSSLEQSDSIRQTVANCAAGAARAIQKHCNRDFVHLADRLHTCDANRTYILLPAAPITALGGENKYCANYESPWRPLAPLIARTDAAAGILHLAYPPGDSTGEIVIHYSAGYSIDTTPDRSATPPEGIPKLPADLYLAWLELTGVLWQARNQRLLAAPTADTAAPAAAIPPAIQDILAPYVRLTA